MNFRELARQAYEIDQQLSAAAKKAFDFGNANQLIFEEEQDDNGLWGYWNPSKRDWKYTGYEIGANGLDISGEAYAGCGDYEHTNFHVPYEQLDNLEAWAEQRKAHYAEKKRLRLEEAAAKEAEEQREADEAERKQFEKLKVKYEGAQQ
jgi:hypothetical protein